MDESSGYEVPNKGGFPNLGSPKSSILVGVSLTSKWSTPMTRILGQMDRGSQVTLLRCGAATTDHSSSNLPITTPVSTFTHSLSHISMKWNGSTPFRGDKMKLNLQGTSRKWKGPSHSRHDRTPSHSSSSQATCLQSNM